MKMSGEQYHCDDLFDEPGSTLYTLKICVPAHASISSSAAPGDHEFEFDMKEIMIKAEDSPTSLRCDHIYGNTRCGGDRELGYNLRCYLLDKGGRRSRFCGRDKKCKGHAYGSRVVEG